ncbi:hypothetical protein [Parafrankia sp. BMG5.11]|uniref:hypothetical protein n=1 Tax=Parafrankia sp. BMG5.11 TaxID=222540 RepID=UPI000DA598E4|nr:hypothetical protein [Parafrankia sp. BMG5.11]SQD94390.1 hypothetical protein FMEAI12_2540004 [Parafrankia sp. Ea1.12]
MIETDSGIPETGGLSRSFPHINWIGADLHCQAFDTTAPTTHFFIKNMKLSGIGPGISAPDGSATPPTSTAQTSTPART